MDLVLDKNWPSPVHVELPGPGLASGRPLLVLLHGALHDHSVWRDLASQAVETGWTPLALDLPAHGRSGGPPLDSVKTLGHWVNACLDHLHVTTAAIAGHSMGSLIALEAASQRPERYTALCLLATAFPMKVSPKLFAMGADRPQEALAWINKLSWSRPVSLDLAAEGSTWHPEDTLHLMEETLARCPTPSLLLHDFQLCDAYAGAPAAWPQVRCPTHVWVGEHDVMTPPTAAQPLIDALGATVHRLAAGHLLMQECPRSCWATMSQALGNAPRDTITP
jgi:pimeloyl-ACP methyl ester carboxylesterase